MSRTARAFRATQETAPYANGDNHRPGQVCTAKSQTGFSWSPAASPTLYQRIDHAFISGRPPHSDAQVGSSWRLLDSDQMMSVR